MKTFHINIIFLLLVILFGCFIYGISIRLNAPIESFETSDVEMVVSRYNEDLEWTTKLPFNKYRTTIYNKGNNDDFQKHSSIKTS